MCASWHVTTILQRLRTIDYDYIGSVLSFHLIKEKGRTEGSTVVFEIGLLRGINDGTYPGVLTVGVGVIGSRGSACNTEKVNRSIICSE